MDPCTRPESGKGGTRCGAQGWTAAAVAQASGPFAEGGPKALFSEWWFPPRWTWSSRLRNAGIDLSNWNWKVVRLVRAGAEPEQLFELPA